MNKKYFAIALLLAGLTAASSTPAMAGIANVGGGKKAPIKKVIDNTTYEYNHQYQTINNYNDTSNVINNVKNVTDNKYNDTTKRKDTYSSSSSSSSTWTFNGSTANSQSAINSLIESYVISYVESGRSGYTRQKGAYFVSYNNGNPKWYCKGSYGWGVYTLGWSSTSQTSSSTTSTTTSTKQTGHELTSQKLTDSYQTSDTKTKVDVTTTLKSTTNTEETTGYSDYDKLTSIKYNVSNNGILIGDTDNYGNAYVAQGEVEQENHYDRTRTFDVMHTTTNEYDRHTTTTNNTTVTTHNTYDRVYTDTYNTNTNTHTDTVYAVSCSVTVSPIILDLDGDGKCEASNGKYMPHHSEYGTQTTLFDFYGDGFPLITEWVGKHDGLLCRPNEDGSVNGTNLFGTANGYANGYDELSTLDANNNGAIEGDELNGLMVWVDDNGNAIADKGELKTLESLGITSIGVNHKNYSCSFVRNGKSYKTFDWWPSMVQIRKVDVAMNVID